MTAPGKNSPRTARRRTTLILLAAGSLALLSTCAFTQIFDPLATVPIDPGLPEKTSDLYQDPQPVRIDSYDDDCMEAFVTGDGNYLLFNNSNSAFVETHIHLCKRLGKNHFQHLGLLAGSVSKSKDMAPTIDNDGHLFYTCLLTYDKDGHSIYCGDFSRETLKNIALPNGDISPHKPAEINMDCGVSKDGKTLILSRAHFANPLLPPDRSDLALAEMEEKKFVLNPQRQSVLSKLNTVALEYAPCLSPDQRELYFTRCSKRPATGDARKFEADLRIMVAHRKDRFSPYGEPERLAALTGFIEAPTITDDKQEMFFHKKVGDKFRLFCATRKANEKQPK